MTAAAMLATGVTFAVLTVVIAFNSGVVVQIACQQSLYRCIRADILAGRLQAGEKLPSKRSLARQLGISRQTLYRKLH